MPLIRKFPFFSTVERPYVPIIRLTGVIGSNGAILGGEGLTIDALAEGLSRVFQKWRPKGIALIINCPGGSPVQTSLIAHRIECLSKEEDVPVFAFIHDVAASGGYWLATAADEIYANPSSIVGSIGVITAGFGFQDLLKKVGIERRVYTAGINKMQLDPFQDEKKEDIKHLKDLQKAIHQNFIDQVKRKRGDRLTAKDSELFNGNVWTGEKAVELGLIDGIGDVREVMRDKFGEDVQLREVTVTPQTMLSRIGLTSLKGMSSRAILSAFEERMIWNRFGL